MRSLLLLVILVRVAHADGFPTSGPCDDIAACEKACKAGKPAGSCYWGGVLAMQGTGEDRKTKGRDLFAKACTKGDVEACYQVARIDDPGESGDAKARAKARGEFDKACNKGHARACFALVGIYTKGDDAEKTKKQAAAAQKKAAKALEQRCTKQKLANACSWAADLYAGTSLLAADPKKAEDLRQRGCQIRDHAPCPPPAPPPPPPGRPQNKAASKGADPG